MKQKRLLTWILAVALVVAALCMVACGDNASVEGSATLVIGEETYTVDYEEAGLTSDNTAFDVLLYAAGKEENLSVDCNYSIYGAYIKSVSTLDLSAKNSYVALFVNDESYKDTSVYCLDNKIVNNVTYYYSGVGISSIKLADGLSILLAVETY